MLMVDTVLKYKFYAINILILLVLLYLYHKTTNRGPLSPSRYDTANKNKNSLIELSP